MADAELKLRNVTAWVEIEKRKLPMYDIQISEDGERITCWIPSESGKEFEVCYSVDESLPTTGRLFVDGAKCDGIYIRPGHSSPARLVHTSVGDERRKLAFADVQVTEDEAYLEQAVPQELGEIRLIVDQVKHKGFISPTTRIKKSDPFKGIIHERSKKALGHCVKLGATLAAPPFKWNDVARVRTLGTFVFRYRSIEILRANGRAPPDPNRKRRKRKSADETGTASVVNRVVIEIEDDGEGAREDDKEKVKQEREREEEISRLRARLKELEDSRPKKRVRIKQEVKQEIKQEHVPVRIHREVIDLT
ncbi:hypothetical protein AX16_002912 [Volvariella volvacea WC 439]|nr:hypothetical protein AX16_002912 [Volvariella volvacea WC 439]